MLKISQINLIFTQTWTQIQTCSYLWSRNFGRISLDYPDSVRWQHFAWIAYKSRLGDQFIFSAKLRSRVRVGLSETSQQQHSWDGIDVLKFGSHDVSTEAVHSERTKIIRRSLVGGQFGKYFANHWSKFEPVTYNNQWITRTRVNPWLLTTNHIHHREHVGL